MRTLVLSRTQSAQASGHPEPWQLMRSGLYPEKMRGKRGRRWARMGRFSSVVPRGGSQLSGGWACSELRVARKPPHATVLLARVASKRSGGPGQQQQKQQQQKQQTAPAQSSVGGTLVRHEVTAAHTRSLFCSLLLFCSPLESDSCHSQRSQEFLVRSGATGIAC